ncbi:MAG: hypothetical protein EYC69_11900 [Bacteroidetes bacterium]|nr:MAG: hypothetical protein EYC69_11900 [Bacteroidota bacterium]
MKNRIYQFAFILSFKFAFIGSIESFAQEYSQMFMFQIDGNNYIKKSFDSSGKLKSFQIFKVGKVVKNLNKYEMDIMSFEFNNAGKMTDSSITKFICKPSSNEVLLNILPFADLNSNKKVEVELITGENIYPTKWEIGEKVKDHSYSLTLKGGFLSVLGTRSGVKVYDRGITKKNDDSAAFTLTSKVEIKSYMLGLNINTMNFFVEEIIDPRKGIISQIFTESSGDYFTINLSNSK